VDQIVALPHSQAVVLAVLDGSLGAGLHALGAEKAAAEVESEVSAVNVDGGGRAGLGAGTAPVRALGRVHNGQTAEAIRKHWHFGRIPDRAVALLQTGKRDSQHTFSLQVVSAVRQVKAFVTQREIRDLLIPQGQRQSVPVVEGRVHDFVASEAAFTVRERNMTDLAAPALNEADGKVVGLESQDVRPNRAIGEFVELTADERHRSLDFQPAHVGTGEDVAGLPGGDGDLSKTINARREVLPRVL